MHSTVMQKKERKKVDNIHERNTNAGKTRPLSILFYEKRVSCTFNRIIVSLEGGTDGRLNRRQVNEGGSLFITSTNINILMALK